MDQFKENNRNSFNDNSTKLMTTHRMGSAGSSKRALNDDLPKSNHIQSEFRISRRLSDNQK